MAYDTDLAQRLKAHMNGLEGLTEKKMFGGVGYMLHGNMACGVHGQGLIVRIGPDEYAAALAKPHTRVFDLTGRVMTGWLVVDPPGYVSEDELQAWIDLGVRYALSLPRK